MNNGGFVIDRILLTKGGINGPTLDSNQKKFPIGKSQNVKLDVTSRYTKLNLYVNHDLWDDQHVQNCGKVASLKIDKSTKQITNVILPNGTKLTTSYKLDNNKDQIVRVSYKITGAAKHSGCKFKSVSVSNR